MIQHNQSHCLTCQRPTLHVRNSYDVPHIGHLVLVCFLATASLVTAGGVSTLAAFAAVTWLGIWALHTAANLLAVGRPFRCNLCGSVAASAAAQADASEQQRLQAAMAKGAAMRNLAGAAG